MLTRPSFLPVLLTDHAVHVGRLHETPPLHVRDSQEGSCLSVSHAPNAWVDIVRLGGEPWNCLSKIDASPVAFLNMHAVLESTTVLEPIIDWAQNAGYLSPQSLWKVWSLDSETDAWSFHWVDSEASGWDEVENPDARGPKGVPLVEPGMLWVPTPALSARMRQPHDPNQSGLSEAVIAWAEDHVPNLDGVWWNERYDPETLSAPRAGIFASRLPRFTVMLMNATSVDEYEDQAAPLKKLRWRLPTDAITDERAALDLVVPVKSSRTRHAKPSV